MHLAASCFNFLFRRLQPEFFPESPEASWPRVPLRWGATAAPASQGLGAVASAIAGTGRNRSQPELQIETRNFSGTSVMPDFCKFECRNLFLFQTQKFSDECASQKHKLQRMNNTCIGYKQKANKYHYVCRWSPRAPAELPGAG